MGELIGHVREAVDRFCAGDLDAFDADQAIFQYSRVAKELWKFCDLTLLGLRIFEATGADITDLSEVHGHQVLTVVGTGDKIAVLPLPPAVARAVARDAQGRLDGPILRNRAGTRISRHSATSRLRRLAAYMASGT